MRRRHGCPFCCVREVAVGLLETLIVLAIVLWLVGLLVPAFPGHGQPAIHALLVLVVLLVLLRAVGVL
jgi:hypothetical protein